ncbi:hypothetical protein GIB67_031613 [Kingdonia uniflora]|uniref:Uncharacterized protein n=1 Tax=Kingdonia uniflora TaxID=39325 RepID=A0A7J7LYF9_9MAGN|nr:hypothetical protein GIB67_031613 [Kingdonia uniflora]
MLNEDRGDGESCSGARLKSGSKEARNCSLFEQEKNGKTSSTEFSMTKVSKCSLETNSGGCGKSCFKQVDDSQSQGHTAELFQVYAKKPIKKRKCQAFDLDSNAFCCVCGSSDQDEVNRLLECSCCKIRVCC